jgi:hypothetical protein
MKRAERELRALTSQTYLNKMICGKASSPIYAISFATGYTYSGIRGDARTVELLLAAASKIGLVKIELGLTRWLRHFSPQSNEESPDF